MLSWILLIYSYVFCSEFKQNYNAPTSSFIVVNCYCKCNVV